LIRQFSWLDHLVCTSADSDQENLVQGPASIRLHPNFDLLSLKSLVTDHVLPFENASRDDQSFSLTIPQMLHEKDILQMVTPKIFGGKGAEVADLIWVIRELSYGSPSVAATYIGNLLGYSALLMYANESLRDELARSYLMNFSLWSFAMTEAGAGSDLMSIATRAKRVEGGFLLNGEKNFITNANHSSQMVVFAALEDEGISCFYVHGESEGLTRGPAYSKIGWKKANTGSLHFKDVFIPSAHLLGEPGQGLRILTHCLNRSKTLLGAMGVGISIRAFDLCVDRLLNTERFQKALLEQAAIKHQLARMATATESAWMMVARAAATWDAGLAAVKESSMAKLVGGSTAVSVSNQAMELFGARGFLQDYEISRLVSDAKAIEIVEGPSLVQELLIAKEILPRKKKSDLYSLQASDLKKAS
jgi:alkylation response protein AidB-like acyl-CoA dehydrogenase